MRTEIEVSVWRRKSRCHDFVRVKIIEDLCKLNEKVTPTLKDEINDVDKVNHPVLLEVACKLRNNVS